MKKQQFKVCIVYRGRVEKCIYPYANSYSHAINIGRMEIKKMYGSRITNHYVTAEKIKKYGNR